MWRDVVRTYRGLFQRPSFFLAVVFTMALGIGANSAIFSVVDAVLLKPLPYPGSDRLMAIFESNASKQAPRSGVAPGRLEEWNRMSASFSGMAGAYTERMADTSGALPEKLVTARVSPRFFTVLGTAPLVGRGLSPDEDTSGGPLAAIISERLWQQRFNRDPQVTGKMLRFADRGYPIVGVVPDSFRFPVDNVDVWMPAKFGDFMMRARTSRFYTSVGRLKEGATVAAAQADLAAVQGRLAQDFAATDAGWTALVEPLKEKTVGGVRRTLWILFGAVSLVLLIACANVACLLLAQATRREREIAVRFSLGARRAQVIRGLLREAVCATLPGAALGLVLAVAGGRWFRHAAAGLPRADEIHLDWRIVLFTFSVTVATAIAFGLFPALEATRGALAQGARALIGGRQRLLRTLVCAQIALAIVLLVGAGLLIRTLTALSQTPLGFRPENVLTLRISGSWSETANIPLVAQRLGRTLEALDAIPGVQGSAVTASLPGTGESYPQPFGIPGKDSREMFADFQAVSPDYFRLIGIPMLAGETCRVSFEQRSPSPVLVNRSFVDRFLPGENQIGQRLTRTYGPLEIVGVVGDVREHGYGKDPAPVVYSCGLPGFFPDPFYLVRTAQDPATLVETVRRRIQELEPNRAVYDAKPLLASLGSSLDEKRFQTMLLSLFGATALLLAAIGLYGITSFFVGQRRREIGLRAALGAQPSQILAHVFRQGVLATAAGIAVGLIAAAAGMRLIATMLFGVTALDPVTFALAPLLLALVAGVALWIPARRATRVDPLEALRED